MSEVRTLLRPVVTEIAGHAHAATREAIRVIEGDNSKVVAAIVVVLGTGCSYAQRLVIDHDAMTDFDAYSRAAALCGLERDKLIA